MSQPINIKLFIKNIDNLLLRFIKVKKKIGGRNKWCHWLLMLNQQVL